MILSICQQDIDFFVRVVIYLKIHLHFHRQMSFLPSTYIPIVGIETAASIKWTTT